MADEPVPTRAYRAVGKLRVTTEHGTRHLFDFDRRRYTRLPLESPNKLPQDRDWLRIVIRPQVLEVGKPFRMLLDHRESRLSSLVTKVEVIDTFD